ncbi:MAG: HAD-IA family hydrolase [Propionibacterium sp.]|nr:HAD-IA family hydrolase [Actinomyces sp.]MDN6794760.1 HAD-IA family hydrolase [Propionibacterium sp.]
MHNVIWDMGGTLVDTYPQVDDALARAVWSGVPTPAHLAEVRELRTRSIAHAMDILSTRYEVDPTLLHRSYNDLISRWQTDPAPLMPGARELLDTVHRVGGLNLVATHRDRRSAQALLGALDVHVDDLVCASDGFARKPDPQMYEVLLARHHLLPAEALCVGDRIIDMQAAAACAMPSALLVTPGQPVPDPGGTASESLAAPTLPPIRRADPAPLCPVVIHHLRELIPVVSDCGAEGSSD